MPIPKTPILLFLPGFDQLLQSRQIEALVEKVGQQCHSALISHRQEFDPAPAQSNFSSISGTRKPKARRTKPALAA
jgi:hypothetical protein